MADFYGELTTYLKAQAGITALVGSGTAARIFSETPRQGATLPFIVIREVGGGPSFEYLGGIGGIALAFMNVYCYGATRSSADQVSEAVRLAGPLQTYRGLMGSTYARVSAPLHREVGIDQPTDKQDLKRWWIWTTYQIWHDQATS